MWLPYPRKKRRLQNFLQGSHFSTWTTCGIHHLHGFTTNCNVMKKDGAKKPLLMERGPWKVHRVGGILVHAAASEENRGCYGEANCRSDQPGGLPARPTAQSKSEPYGIFTRLTEGFSRAQERISFSLRLWLVSCQTAFFWGGKKRETANTPTKHIHHICPVQILTRPRWWDVSGGKVISRDKVRGWLSAQPKNDHLSLYQLSSWWSPAGSTCGGTEAKKKSETFVGKGLPLQMSARCSQLLSHCLSQICGGGVTYPFNRQGSWGSVIVLSLCYVLFPLVDPVLEYYEVAREETSHCLLSNTDSCPRIALSTDFNALQTL